MTAETERERFYAQVDKQEQQFLRGIAPGTPAPVIIVALARLQARLGAILADMQPEATANGVKD
jgi:hypothetical protein